MYVYVCGCACWREEEEANDAQAHAILAEKRKARCVTTAALWLSSRAACRDDKCLYMANGKEYPSFLLVVNVFFFARTAQVRV